MPDLSAIPHEERRMENQARFSVEVVNARTGEEKTLSWQSRQQIIVLFTLMREGDALVINHVGYAEEGAIYP